MISASADASARMWDVQTGRELVVYNHMGPVRSVAFAEGGQRFATVSDPFTDSPGLISVFETPDDVPTDQCEGPVDDAGDGWGAAVIAAAMFVVLVWCS